MLFKRAAPIVCFWAVVSAIQGAPSITQIAQDPRDNPLASVAVSRDGDIYVVGKFLGVARVNPSDGTFTTVAGGGTDPSDGIPALSALLSSPQRLIFDPVGNLVLSDDSRVRRIDLSKGTITTIAGSMSNGFAGDGYAATLAELSSPRGLAFDASGNLFIADSGNQRVRRVDGQTGIITTIVGGRASGYSGSIGNVSDVAVDANGDLLLASPNLAQVYRADDTGAISLFAGNGASWTEVTGDGGAPGLATFCKPSNLKFDSTGSLFILDGERFTNQPYMSTRCGGGGGVSMETPA